MIRRTLLLLTAFLAAGSSSWAAPHPETGTRAVNILSVQPGARPRAMGNAFTAVPDDANALWFNPAGFGTIKYWDFVATHKTFLADMQQSHVGTVLPLSFLTSDSLMDFGAVGASIGLLDYGTFSGRDAAGAPDSDFTAKDGLLTLGYGKSIGALSVGVNAKMYKLKISGHRAEGTAYDIGMMYKPKASFWGFGAAVKNLGGQVRYAQVDEPLPQEVTAGVSMVPLRDKFMLNADLVNPKDSYAGYRAGAEYWANRIIALRAGYDSTLKAGSGFSGGIGISLERIEAAFFPVRRLTIDYSFVPADDLDNTHSISVSFRFGE